MQNEANKNNISFKVISGTRNFTHQKRIWNYKWNEKYKNIPVEKRVLKILEFSAMPSTSRHHWGTDIDIYQTNVKQPRALLLESNFHNNGAFCKLKEWMDIHAKDYGFYLVYTNLPNRKGFKYEPWHYSYKPLSFQYLKAYKKLDIAKVLKTDKLLGSDNITKDFKYFTFTLSDHYFSVLLFSATLNLTNNG